MLSIISNNDVSYFLEMWVKVSFSTLKKINLVESISEVFVFFVPLHDVVKNYGIWRFFPSHVAGDSIKNLWGQFWCNIDALNWS